MWARCCLALLLASAALSAQASRSVTFVWDVDTGDTGVAARLERDGVLVPCPVMQQPTATERRCTVTVPVGAAAYRAQMANPDPAWGEWSPLATVTVPPVAPGDPPGPFIIRLPLPGTPGGDDMTPVQTAPVSLGVDTANTRGTEITGGGSAGTFTATPVQIDASLAVEAAGLWVHLLPGSSDTYNVRLFVGGSGSEVEIATVPMTSSTGDLASLFVPIPVPAGSRISAALATNGSSAVGYLHLTPVRGRSYDPIVSRGRTYGVTSGAPTDVDAGGTAHTKGAWVQLTGSTSVDAKGYSLVFIGDYSTTTLTRFLLDVGIGAAASEQIIAADVPFIQESFRTRTAPNSFGPIWTPIPAGTRIAVRAAASNNTSTDRVPRVALVIWE